MERKRKIVIDIKNQSIKKEVVNYIKSFNNEFKNRNVEIIYKLNTNLKSNIIAKLYGYDNRVKSQTTVIEKIGNFINLIDSMPLGKREKLLRMCNLPDTYETSHCFNDNTHHTCCILGPDARKYADNSGNPIGIASENAFKKRFKKDINKRGKTNWCTCTGSKVCSYYSKIFDDGTRIQFIGDTNTLDEDEGINRLKLLRHRTPGIP